MASGLDLLVGKFIDIKCNRKLQFVYDASGAKLRKIANDNGTVTTYDYVNGVEYTNNTLERIPHTEGEIVKDGGGNYVYEYTLKDHLGNTRVTFGDADNNGVVENSDIKQINHYYPFGMNLEGPGFGAQGANKYQFGEKELNTDFGLNWSDFGARWYQSDVPRFLSIDPMAEMYVSMSPYHYGKNSPMVYADPTGMMSEAYNFGMSGSSGSAHDMYQRDAAISQSASGTTRAANQDDYRSGIGTLIPYGYRTTEVNVIEGYDFIPNDGFIATYDKNGHVTYQRISDEGGNNYDVIYSGCVPCGTGRSYRIDNTSGGMRTGVGTWMPSPATGAVEAVDDPITSGELKVAMFLGGVILKNGAKSAFKHALKYHPRIRARGVEDGIAHNFPYSFDDIILKTKPIVQKDGSLMYKHLGYMNGTEGYFEIAVNPKTQLIFHRQFNSKIKP